MWELGALSLASSQQAPFLDPDARQKLLVLTLRVRIKERFAAAAKAFPDGLHRLNSIGIVE